MDRIKIFFKNFKGTKNILIMIGGGILLLLMAVAFVPSYAWLFGTVILYLFIDFAKSINAKDNIRERVMQERANVIFEDTYPYIAESLYSILKDISADMGFVLTNLGSILLPSDKRISRCGEVCIFRYSCKVKTDNTAKTLSELRDYINRELQLNNPPDQPLPHVMKVYQQAERIFFAVTLIENPQI